MPSLKEYKAKLASLKNTRKMTKTMKMVSASKLYRTMDAQRKATAMAEQVKKMIQRLAAAIDPSADPLFQVRDPARRILVLLITSDKGLCGGFNNNLIKFVSRWLEDDARAEQDIVLSCCGRRGHLFFRSRREIYRHYEGVTQKPGYHHAEEIGAELRQNFLAGQFDEVYLAYNHFINPISQKPVIEKLLPVAPEEDADAPVETAAAVDYLLEPSREELLRRLLPMTVDFKLYYALLENAAGENGARMTAMDNATTNASKLIDLYTLLRNRARQAAITKELIEIISGAEALKS
ncbi:MAG TPA: ATP synthase F1 subunit gamma [Kiritimatiellia bacterium]|nr:ATP synthase F1 subunit gamma [Kiritimatiellia bacterium]HMO99680.1 ATP synthase F1 subunit gamma [Kiritimatiellia bacterium]HMP96146.1 ATP synthase F1 subunit gamma [Kiritimatiellia bacterium]